MARSIDVGDIVEIKSGYHKGDWGKVVLIDEDYEYHIAMFGDSNDCPVFSRNEIKLSKWKPSDIQCSSDEDEIIELTYDELFNIFDEVV